MKKIWVNRAKSFKDAEKFEDEYYSKMTEIERLETVQFLRELYSKLKKTKKNEGRKGLRRFIKIIQQT